MKNKILSGLKNSVVIKLPHSSQPVTHPQLKCQIETITDKIRQSTLNNKL